MVCHSICPAARTLLSAALLLTLLPVHADDEAPISHAPLRPETVPGEYVVGFDVPATTGLQPGLLASRLESSGFDVIDSIEEIHAYVVRTPGASLSATRSRLSAVGPVRYVEPNFRVHPLRTPNDPQYPLQWALPKIGGPAAWESTMGSDVIVAIVDTGVELGHEDLGAPVLWRNRGETAGNGVDDDHNGIVDDVHGARFFGGASGDPSDNHGHGTHVAGTVGAATDNGMGVTGVTWKRRLMGVKFLNPTGSSADGARSIVYAVQNGAQIIQCSWGSYGYAQVVQDAVTFAERNDRILVAAAGNQGNNNDSATRMYPASYPNPNIIAVLSTESNDSMSSFSNYGATSVDIGAPGRSIRSTYLGNRYESLSGTSMAAPHVSGAAVLVKSLAGSWSNRNVRQYLLDSALPVASLAGRSVTGGRLDVDRATRSPARITEPAAGATWRPGDTAHIAWTEAFRSTTCPKASIALSLDDGATFPTSLATGAPLAQLGIDVLAGSAASATARVRVACEDTSLATVSEPFSIVQPLRVVQPAPGVKWRGGRRVTVEWDGGVDAGGDPACATVDIEYSKDGGATFVKRLASATPNDGNERVRAPYRKSREAVVRVACSATPDSDTSDPFRSTNPLPLYLTLLVLLGVTL